MPTRAPDLPPHASGQDRAVAIARALAGVVPFAGPALAELITEFVPGQRQQRLHDWLCRLAERIATLEEATLRARLREPENIALIEDGAYEAVRAISEERRQQIADLVAGGIIDARYLESRRVLRLLGELDHAELIMLAGYLHKNRSGEFAQRYANVLQTPAVYVSSGQEERDAAAVHEAGRQHLLQLGLLEQRMPTPPDALGRRRWPSDAFTSRVPVVETHLSRLGRLLLRRTGFADDNDR
jgi:hypothetical protein